jgi:hypothetical protein
MLANVARIVPLVLLGGMADLFGIDKVLVGIGLCVSAAGLASQRAVVVAQ